MDNHDTFSQADIDAFKAADAVRLPDGDRVRIRANLAAYAKAHPRTSIVSRFFGAGAPKAVPSPYQSWLRRPMPAIAAVLILILIGGGTSYAAEGALPGDALYPIKVNVNEPIQEALAFTPQSKAAVAANIAVTRLDEAQQLAAAGKLSTTTAVMLDANLQAHVTQADSAAAALAKSDPLAAAETQSSLDARLNAHRDILQAVADSNDESRGAATGLLASLTAKLDASTSTDRAVNMQALAHASDQSFTALEGRAKSALGAASAAVTSAKATTSVATATSTAVAAPAFFLSRASTTLASAQSSYDAGASALAAGDRAAAYLAFMQSLAASAQAQTYADAATRVSASVSIPAAFSAEHGEGARDARSPFPVFHAASTTESVRRPPAFEWRSGTFSTTTPAQSGDAQSGTDNQPANDWNQGADVYQGAAPAGFGGAAQASTSWNFATSSIRSYGNDDQNYGSYASTTSRWGWHSDSRSDY
ncbi:MAG TPA: DUF5667 domain-containing protein [Candidatus Paceibacterota bacterium]|nr:DUF5667 domain-containing protein [Candidatus Paceibacterota bacterium]